jgi:hypothetical protein
LLLPIFKELTFKCINKRKILNPLTFQSITITIFHGVNLSKCISNDRKYDAKIQLSKNVKSYALSRELSNNAYGEKRSNNLKNFQKAEFHVGQTFMLSYRKRWNLSEKLSVPLSILRIKHGTVSANKVSDQYSFAKNPD